MYYVLMMIDGEKRWEECESRLEVAETLLREKKNDDPDVKIFLVDDDGELCQPSVSDIFACL